MIYTIVKWLWFAIACHMLLIGHTDRATLAMAGAIFNQLVEVQELIKYKRGMRR